ncbi:hypothetical protein OAK22_01660 [Nitrosopumilus sp.]|nr:hypothetical protein [Nitrosopumilus sp.]
MIDEKGILLENRWKKIKDDNQWGKLEKGSEKPNWICKDCYDGGIIVEQPKAKVHLTMDQIKSINVDFLKNA